MSISALVRLSLLLFSLALLTGCAKPAYVTTARKSELGGLKDQKLCVISFSAAPDLEVMGGTVTDALRTKLTEKKEREKQLAAKIADAHLSEFIPEFRQHFTFVGPTDSGSVNQPVPLTDKARISDAIAKASADVGVIVYDKYGWTCDSGTVLNYNVETRVSLVNRQADLIWQFHSAATFLAAPDVSAKGLISTAIGRDPDDATILRGLSRFLSQYPKVVVKLIDEDIAGQPHQAKFEDYISGYSFWKTKPPLLRTKSD